MWDNIEHQVTHFEGKMCKVFILSKLLISEFLNYLFQLNSNLHQSQSQLTLYSWTFKAPPLSGSHTLCCQSREQELELALVAIADVVLAA